MSIAIVIPAQKNNKYHNNGDLAPFGDTTLLEWKISQCIEYFDSSSIYISTDSKEAQLLAEYYNINIIFRKENQSFSEMVIETTKYIKEDHIIWVNTTSPFLSGLEYKNMKDSYLKSLDKYDSLISITKKNEFIYYKNKKLNFDKHSSGRKVINPILLATNGVYINSKENILRTKELIGNIPLLYNLDFLESLEIKDTQTYIILSELISLYFKKELNV